MLKKIFLFLVGYLLMVIGFIYIILYINLLSFGYSLGEYIGYVFTRFECLVLIIGFIFIILAFRKEKKC